MALPTRIPGRWLRIDGGDVAVVAIRPVARVALTGHRARRRVRDALLRSVPPAGATCAGVLRAVVAGVARRRRVARTLDRDDALAGLRVGHLADGVGIGRRPWGSEE